MVDRRLKHNGPCRRKCEGIHPKLKAVGMNITYNFTLIQKKPTILTQASPST